MSFQSYLISPYNHRQENIFFYEIEALLNKYFNKKDGLHILIGNLNCNGHEFDALFLKKGQITVIDFKDYSGQINFSENNPWVIDYKGKQVFVAGGSAHMNPLQQVKSYKFGLLEYLSKAETSILSANRNNIDWGHISTMVLFHNEVTFNSGAIPDNVKPWFSIKDPSNVLQELNHRYSKRLEFNDYELKSILERLDVSEVNKYDNAQFQIEDEETKETRNGNFELIQRIITNKIPSDKDEKVLEHLKTVIQLERKKGSKLESNLYSIKYSLSGSDIIFNFSDSPDFFSVFKKNENERFPKDVFVGANFSIAGKNYPLLYNIVPISSIKGEIIKVDSSYFDLNESIFTELELPEEFIINLQSHVSSEKNFLKKCEIIAEYFGDESVEFKKYYSIGLSSDAWYTAQLYSELTKINERSNQTQYVSDFLTCSKISSRVSNTLNPKNWVQITNLNEEQLVALEHALTEPITVITGPPGTGKTQLILNILANIISHDKTALFASKNNKAVENVEERLAKIFTVGFIPRFGSKMLTKTVSKEKIGNYFVSIQNEAKASSSESQQKIEQYNSVRHLINEKRLLLKQKHDQIDAYPDKLEKLTNEYNIWIKTVSSIVYENVIIENNLPEIKAHDLNIILYDLKNSQGLISGVLFSLNKKSKIKQILQSIDQSLPEWMKIYLSQTAPLSHINKPLKETTLNYTSTLFDLLNECHEIKTKDDQWDQKINKLKYNIILLREDIQSLTNEISNLNNQIVSNRDEFIHYSKIYLNTIRKNKFKNKEILHLNKYLNFIPNSIPWKDDEVREFADTAEEFIKLFNIISVSSLSIKSSFPLVSDLFDYIIIDEASQCDIASVIPLLQRGKKLIVIGDDQQLKHITSVSSEEDKYIADLLDLGGAKRFNYAENSLYDYAKVWSEKNEISTIFLPKHYRSHPDIIKFSNTIFYEKEGKSLEILTDITTFPVEEQGIYWHHISGNIVPNRNINKDEAVKSYELAKLLNEKYPDSTIGIITPFSDQRDLIQSFIKDELGKKVYPLTVHQSQGDEHDIIILSLVVNSETKKSLTKFINDISPFLLNVGVTRARAALHIIGDYHYCINLRAQSPLSQLAQYCQGKRALLL